VQNHHHTGEQDTENSFEYVLTAFIGVCLYPNLDVGWRTLH
jgi:hypothetical protein